MNLVFWTSNICMHSASVFEEVGKNHSVIIACISEYYGNFGSINLKYAQISKIHTPKDVEELISKTSDYVHINGVIKPYAENAILGYALKTLLQRNCIVFALNMEQFQWWGLKGFIRRVQWFYLLNIGIGRKIKAIGCTGQSGIKAFRKSFVNSKRLFDFIYSVPSIDSYLIEQPRTYSKINIGTNNSVQFIYIGQLIDRKCILEVINAFNQISDDYILHIIGAGKLEQQIKHLIQTNNRITFHGQLQPWQIRQILMQTDVLIQASKSEGWGCTINEALTFGNRVIVSNAIGASSLIVNNRTLGQIFQSENWDDFRSCIERDIAAGKQSTDNRRLICNWAKCISPETEATYLTQIITHYTSPKQTVKPTAPWN